MIPIQQATSLEQLTQQIEQSHFYSLFSGEMTLEEKQLLLAAPATVAHALATLPEWLEQPHDQLHLLLLHPHPLDAVDEGRSWGIINYLLGLSGLIPLHLTIVGPEIELADSNANCEELQAITIEKVLTTPIEFLLQHPEYRADAALLLHPGTDFSMAGSHALRELQQREIPIFGSSFSHEESETLQQSLAGKGVAQFSWQHSNPFSLPLQQFTESSAIWGDTLWRITPILQTFSIDQQISDLVRQTVFNIIEGGETVIDQYLADLQSGETPLNMMLNLLGLLNLESRSELTAHLVWVLFQQIRQGDHSEQRAELLRLTANLNWFGANEAAPGEAVVDEPS